MVSMGGFWEMTFIKRDVFCKRCKECDKPIRNHNKSGYCTNCGSKMEIWKNKR